MSAYIEKLVGQIVAKIERLSEDRLVSTNSGTYGDGDPHFDDWKTYEALDGSRRTDGADPKDAPGYARHIPGPSPASRRAQVDQLQQLLAMLRDWPSHEPLPAAQLAKAGINL
nr:hypothetical protein [Desulfuromonadales bacterium]